MTIIRAPAAMRTLKALRWWIIGLVMLGALINFLTRAVMGVAAPTMPTACST